MPETENRLRWVSHDLLVHVVRPLLPDKPRLNGTRHLTVEQEVIDFLAAEIAAMPGYLRMPYQVALRGYNWLALLRYGRPYVGLDPSTQAQYMRSWSDSPLGSMRDFIKLIRSTVLLQYLDHPLVRAELEFGQGKAIDGP
jgi:hypothetical protein